MPFSHHSHSGQFCRHATGKLEEVVLEAIRQGFLVYGLTEHVPRYRTEDLYPEEVLTYPLPIQSFIARLFDQLGSGMEPQALISQFEAFLDEAHRLKELYKSQITLLVGLETEYITDVDLERLDAILEKENNGGRNRIEYIVGSIHHVNGVPIDFDLETFHKALASFSSSSSSLSETETMSNFLCAYFEAHFHIMQRFHPEIIGHIDLCRLYVPQLRLQEDYPGAWELLQRNVAYAAGYGALFEVNAAAFRKNWGTAYPGEDVLRIILQKGGKLALSDDSHGPHAVGLNYHHLLDYLRSQGVSELWFLQQQSEESQTQVKESKPEFDEQVRSTFEPEEILINSSNSGRRAKLRPVRVPDPWWDHLFWKEKSGHD